MKIIGAIHPPMDSKLLDEIRTNHARLVLIRGVPGSGKSHLAMQLEFHLPTAKVFEADQFFMVAGEYQYRPDRIKDAHAWCQHATRVHLQQGFHHIAIVANTFSRRWEMEPYYEMAKELNLEAVLEVTVDGNYPNVHGVPDDVIQRMRDRWEP